MEQFQDYRYNPDYKSDIINSRRAYYKLWSKYYRPLFESVRSRKGITNEVIDDSVIQRYDNNPQAPLNFRDGLPFHHSINKA